MIEETFKMVDKNGDGRLERSEVEAHLANLIDGNVSD